MARKTVKRTTRRRRKPTESERRRGVDYGITGGIAAGMLLLLYALFGKDMPKQFTEFLRPGFAALSAIILFCMSISLHVAGKRGLFGEKYARLKKRRRRKRWWW